MTQISTFDRVQKVSGMGIDGIRVGEMKND